MEKIFRIIFIIGVGLALVFVSLQSLSPSVSGGSAVKLPKFVNTPLDSFIKQPATNINELPFRDNLDLYQNDDPGSVVVMYVTVRQGNSADNLNPTWKQINDFTRFLYTNNPTFQVGKAEAIVQIGDENGPTPGEVGFGEIVPNATIQLRGTSTSMIPQKSYKIELNNSAGKWRGQSTIALNKHVNDPSRVRNKLNFDLMKQIPNMVSLRTQFVHLYVKDQTTDPWGTAFVDYGLFTQVELPNKKFLRNHLLDPDGQLYKPTQFEFLRYPDQIRLVDDPLYNVDSFSAALESKGNKDHSKLIQMLDDVNDPNIPIQQTFEKYFNADNYFTWMAYNILAGNVDTEAQNFYLYSPHNGNKFYFIPWDYDDSFFRQDREKCCGYPPYYSFEYGVADYWGNHLANRLLRMPEYRQMLDGKVSELMLFLTPERITNLLDTYKPVAQTYALQMPDLLYFPTTKQGMDLDYKLIPSEVQLNYNLYLDSLKTSMPFSLGAPKVTDGSLEFNWDESYDFNGQKISYHFMVAKDWAFKEIVSDQTLSDITNIKVPLLPPGEYFWQVTATNESGKLQYAFDVYFDTNGEQHSGLKRFYITPAGEVLE
jgi:spore coat protein H